MLSKTVIEQTAGGAQSRFVFLSPNNLSENFAHS
jgi:hypothetical protein